MAEGSGDTIFLIDDDPGVVRALSRLIASAGMHVEPYTSPRDFLDHYSPDIPGCVIVDVAMGEWNGLDLQKQLCNGNYERPVIFISGRSDLPTGVRAMKAGAVDFLTKPVDAVDLFRAIKTALARDAKARRDVAEISTIRRRLESLSQRERDVFLGVVQGKLNKQIAFELGITEKTAKVHRARVMSKMEARNVAELVRMAEHAGILNPDQAA
jgi:FixJ family two-component response regulator